MLVIALGAVGVAQIADPQPRPRPAPPDHAAAPDGDGEEINLNPPSSSYPTHPSEQPSEEGPSRERVTPHDAHDVRTCTRQFTHGYLAFSYGRGAAEEITNATRELIAQLQQHPPRVPDRIRRRHPRVELVHPDAIGKTQAAAVAIVNDGHTRYAVHVRLVRTGMEE